MIGESLVRTTEHSLTTKLHDYYFLKTGTILQEKVINSEFHQQYLCLNLESGNRNINDGNNVHLIQTTFRIRGELLELNYQQWKRQNLYVLPL